MLLPFLKFEVLSLFLCMEPAFAIIIHARGFLQRQAPFSYAVAEVTAGEGETEVEADELACAVVGVESDSEPDHIFGVCLFLNSLQPTPFS